jgi:CRISPR-associated endonuclease/helicase Cas3
VDIQLLARTAAQEEAGDGQDAAGAEEQAMRAEQDKLEALDLWGTPLVVTTADTVLGLLANGRRALVSAPAILQSAIVFDEVHAFDDQMFGHLLVLLKNFPGLPVLLMTASLPEERLHALHRVRADLCVVDGPPELEAMERYELIRVDEEPEIWRAIDRTLAEQGKVLWVRNQVEWANQTYLRCCARYRAIDVDVYHSRLKYLHRSCRHRRVIDAFKQPGRPAVLVATQVAEMSLDLSADLLITDQATVPALIQRFGRLNRRSPPPRPRPALVCPVQPAPLAIEQPVGGDPVRPYRKEDLELSGRWLKELMALGKPLGQRELAHHFVALSGSREPDYGRAERNACLLGVAGETGVWRTRPGETRDEGYTVRVMMQEDRDGCPPEHRRWGEPTPDWLTRHEIAMPFRPGMFRWPRLRGLLVVPAGAIAYDYDPETRRGTGARWNDA